MTLEKGSWCLWSCFKSLSVGSVHSCGCKYGGVITSKFSVPGYSYSVLEDRFQKGKAKSRFCGMKTYLECGITLWGSEVQPGATHIHLLKQDIFCEGSERLVTPAILSVALALLMVVRADEFLIGLVGNGVLVVWSFGEQVRKFNRSLYNLIVPGLAVC